MTPRNVIDRGDPDGEALGRRLLAELGVARGALFVAHADALAAIVAAVNIGAVIGARMQLGVRECRVCGCTDLATCRASDPCHWVGEDLCSACQPYVAEDSR